MLTHHSTDIDEQPHRVRRRRLRLLVHLFYYDAEQDQPHQQLSLGTGGVAVKPEPVASLVHPPPPPPQPAAMNSPMIHSRYRISLQHPYNNGHSPAHPSPLAGGASSSPYAQQQQQQQQHHYLPANGHTPLNPYHQYQQAGTPISVNGAYFGDSMYSFTPESTRTIAPPVVPFKKFIYFAEPDALVGDVRRGIAEMYSRLYPRDPPLEFMYLRDRDMYDVADEFLVSDGFSSSPEIYAAVKRHRNHTVAASDSGSSEDKDEDSRGNSTSLKRRRHQLSPTVSDTSKKREIVSLSEFGTSVFPQTVATVRPPQTGSRQKIAEGQVSDADNSHKVASAPIPAAADHTLVSTAPASSSEASLSALATVADGGELGVSKNVAASAPKSIPSVGSANSVISTTSNAAINSSARLKLRLKVRGTNTLLQIPEDGSLAPPPRPRASITPDRTASSLAGRPGEGSGAEGRASIEDQDALEGFDSPSSPISGQESDNVGTSQRLGGSEVTAATSDINHVSAVAGGEDGQLMSLVDGLTKKINQLHQLNAREQEVSERHTSAESPTHAPTTPEPWSTCATPSRDSVREGETALSPKDGNAASSKYNSLDNSDFMDETETVAGSVAALKSRQKLWGDSASEVGVSPLRAPLTINGGDISNIRITRRTKRLLSEMGLLEDKGLPSVPLGVHGGGRYKKSTGTEPPQPTDKSLPVQAARTDSNSKTDMRDNSKTVTSDTGASTPRSLIKGAQVRDQEAVAAQKESQLPSSNPNTAEGSTLLTGDMVDSGDKMEDKDQTVPPVTVDVAATSITEPATAIIGNSKQKDQGGESSESEADYTSSSDVADQVLDDDEEVEEGGDEMIGKAASKSLHRPGEETKIRTTQDAGGSKPPGVEGAESEAVDSDVDNNVVVRNFESLEPRVVIQAHQANIDQVQNDVGGTSEGSESDESGGTSSSDESEASYTSPDAGPTDKQQGSDKAGQPIFDPKKPRISESDAGIVSSTTLDSSSEASESSSEEAESESQGEDAMDQEKGDAAVDRELVPTDKGSGEMEIEGIISQSNAYVAAAAHSTSSEDEDSGSEGDSESSDSESSNSEQASVPTNSGRSGNRIKSKATVSTSDEGESDGEGVAEHTATAGTVSRYSEVEEGSSSEEGEGEEESSEEEASEEGEESAAPAASAGITATTSGEAGESSGEELAESGSSESSEEESEVDEKSGSERGVVANAEAGEDTATSSEEESSSTESSNSSGPEENSGEEKVAPAAAKASNANPNQEPDESDSSEDSSEEESRNGTQGAVQAATNGILSVGEEEANTTDSESNSKSSSSSEVGSASSSSDESEEEQKLESVPANNAKTRNKRSASQALTPPHAAKVAKTSGHEMLKGTPQPTPTVKSRFSHLNSQTPLLAGARGEEASSAMARSARRMTITPLSEMARSSKFIDLSREAQEIKAKRANASLHASPVGSGTSTPTPLTISAATNAKGATGASPASSEQDESDDDDDTSSSSSSESSSGSSTNRSSSDSSDDDDDSDSGPVQLARSQSEKAATASSPHRSGGGVSRRNTLSGRTRRQNVRLAGGTQSNAPAQSRRGGGTAGSRPGRRRKSTLLDM